ncbi:MAG: RHS repeat-associated core domain-containing protein [Planctomycetia bacterium]|nr:RHS repeat-associated core domain-containing protein [Planctomycetia bacterium]
MSDIANYIVDGTTVGATIAAATFHFEYDAKARLIESTGPEGTRSYKYDGLNQLTCVLDQSGATLESYAFDAAGDRKTSTSSATGTSGYTPDPHNRVDSDGTYAYEYDDRGNRTAKTSLADGTREEYQWDHRNRLVEVTWKRVDGATSGSLTYRYDASNHRIGKKVYDAEGELVDAERYVYAGDKLLLVLDGAGELRLRQFVAEGQVLGQQRTGHGLEWLLTDELGSTRALVAADGTLVAKYSYDAYGNLTAGSGDPTLVRSGWTGLTYDAETGNYYAWNRYLDPRLGDWLNPDPIGFAGGTLNLNQYVGNDPLNNVDPTGLAEYDPSYYSFTPSFGGPLKSTSDPIRAPLTITPCFYCHSTPSQIAEINRYSADNGESEILAVAQGFGSRTRSFFAGIRNFGAAICDDAVLFLTDKDQFMDNKIAAAGRFAEKASQTIGFGGNLVFNREDAWSEVYNGMENYVEELGNRLSTTKGRGDLVGGVAFEAGFTLIGGKLANVATDLSGLSTAVRSTPANTTFRSGLASIAEGAPMDSVRFQKIKAAFDRNGGIIDQSDFAQMQLLEAGGPGQTGLTLSAKDILMRPNPTASTVFDEMIHTTQFRTGRAQAIYDWVGQDLGDIVLEIEVQQRLLQNSRAWGLTAPETTSVNSRLEGLMRSFENHPNRPSR